MDNKQMFYEDNKLMEVIPDKEKERIERLALLLRRCLILNYLQNHEKMERMC
ncbi:MAG: hypothetical protein LKJ25_03130 [Clostridia bacterium]|nr:hypothetical protein [Clostridia bacterium]